MPLGRLRFGQGHSQLLDRAVRDGVQLLGGRLAVGELRGVELGDEFFHATGVGGGHGRKSVAEQSEGGVRGVDEPADGPEGRSGLRAGEVSPALVEIGGGQRRVRLGAGVDVPDVDGGIVTCGGNCAAVGGRGNRVNTADMANKAETLSLRGNFPKANEPIASADDQYPSIRGKRKNFAPGSVNVATSEFLARSHVPDLKGIMITILSRGTADGRETTAIGREGNAWDEAAPKFECSYVLASH